MKNNLLCLLPLFVITMVLAQTSDRPPRGAQGQSVDQQSSRQTGTNGQGQQGENIENVRAEAEEGIKHVLVSQIEAWNHGDLPGFMNGYWHSPELTFYSGANIAKGWQAALQRYQRTYQGEGKEMGTLEFQDLNIELLSRQAAVVRGKWQLTMSDGKKPHGVFTLIVKRMQAGWKIVHDHTSSAE